MTNEELVEELYHKAHVKGFFHELHDKVSELKKTTKMKRETSSMKHESEDT